MKVLAMKQKKQKNNLLITGAGGSVLTSIMPQVLELHFFDKIYLIDSDEDIAIKHLTDNKKIFFEKCPEGKNDVEYRFFINNFIINHGISYIIPCVDEEIFHLLSVADNIGIDIKLCCPNKYSFILSCLNKFTLNLMLKDAYIPVPVNYDIKELSCSEKIIIAKPKFGHGSKGLYCLSSMQVLELLACGIINSSDYVFQKYLEGDEYTVSVFDKIIVPKKIIKKKGITFAAVTEKNEAVIDVCDAIRKIFEPGGPFNVQGVIDKDGVFKVFEINPRLSTTSILTYMAGINEVKYGFGLNKEEPFKDFKEYIYMYRYYDQIFKDKDVDLILHNQMFL